MTDQPVKRYTLCYRCGVTDYKRRSDCNHPGSSQPMVLEADFSRTAAELRKERSARVEAERRADELAVQTIDDAGVIGALERERDRLAARVAELESRPEIIAQLEDEKRVLAERVAELEQYRAWAEPQIVTHGADLQRIASLESDLSAVTASSVEHAKTIDGLRAELARARERCERLEAGLRKIVARWPSTTNPNCDDYERGYGQATSDIAQIARAPLATTHNHS